MNSNLGRYDSMKSASMMMYSQSQHDSLDLKVNDSEADSLLFVKPGDEMFPKYGNQFSNKKFMMMGDKKRAAYAS